MSGNLTVYLFVKGKVQNVMFRQTIMRGSISRGVVAGATNNRQDRQRVDITLEGPEDKVNEIIEGLRSGKKLNSWGSALYFCRDINIRKKPLEHEVNTSNVDNIKWKKGVEFYL